MLFVNALEKYQRKWRLTFKNVHLFICYVYKIEEFTVEIFPILITLLNDPIPRISGKSAESIAKFLTGMNQQ